MGISWGALAGAFLGPFVYSLYWKRVTKPAVWASFISGVGITTLNMIMGYFGKAFIASSINAGVVAMIVSLVIVPVISVITKKPDSDLMDRVFACYEEKVEVTRKHSLEEEIS